MNLLASFGILLLSVLSGLLIVHLIWNEGGLWVLLFKFFLGIGVGVGVTSLAYFIYLFLFAGQHFFIYLHLAFFVILLLISSVRERRKLLGPVNRFRLNAWQVAMLVSFIVAIAFSIMGALIVWNHRPSGTVDAFMIYDRTARFIYRDQANWLRSFSNEIDPVYKADYPLLIPLNVAYGWDVLGNETNYVPLVFSGLFIFASAGLFFCALAVTKSKWQACVGLIVLLNTTFFIMNGASQTADVPLSFFILSTVVLVYLYILKQNPRLLFLAGLTAGLAGWTKNEGELFIVAAFAALSISLIRSSSRRQLAMYLAGLLVPVAVILYFKVFFAPLSDHFGNGLTRSIQQVLEWPRHLAILNAYISRALIFGESEFGILPVLLVYALIFNFAPDKRNLSAYIFILLAIVFQLAGYYVIYLITPNPVEWQLVFSLERLMLHVYPSFLFLFFVLATDIKVVLNFNDKVDQRELAL